MSNLIDAYVRYRVKNQEIKERQRTEKVNELAPFVEAVGVEIQAERKNGKRIADIGTLLNLKGRTFIYAAIRAAGGHTTEELPEVEEANPHEYNIEYLSDSHDGRIVNAVVTFSDQESYSITINNEDFVTPDEWAEHSRERRQVYKQIIKDISNEIGADQAG